jgi:acetaldehyde dehydrogenase/alcohol dehydrogenase
MSTAIDVGAVMERAVLAAGVFHQFDQTHTDRVVKAVYEAAFANRVRLAKMAVDETGMGRWEDKVTKNVVATHYVYEDIKDLKTVGVVSHDHLAGITELAQPLGPVLAVIPVTNPTSTTLFKILICLKTRNPIIISPHRQASCSASEAARICYEAALRQDAPEDCIQWVTHTSRDETQQLMSHPSLALILATGGGGLVKAAYSSGTPAIGVGAGNVPVYIERSADVPFAVSQIILSKTFDNGVICCSEQAVVVEKAIGQHVKDEFVRQGAWFLAPDQVAALEPVVYDRARGGMNAAAVGQSVAVLAERARISVPEGTKLLLAPLDGVGADYPLSSEILAPVLAYYECKDFQDALKRCIEINYFGGIGHTASIYSNDDQRILGFASLMNAGRIVVNTPSAQGGVGAGFNTLAPSLTLGCGTGGKNITTDNITARHLLNIQRIARRRPNPRMATLDPSLWTDESVDAATFRMEFERNF